MSKCYTENRIKVMLVLMRPKHYLKNFLIFIPLVFSKNLCSPELLLKSMVGFCAFSLLASVIYIFNDIHDVEADRMHEIKRKRPIASGKISIPFAYAIAGILLLSSIICNATCKGGFRTLIIMTLYFITNLGYSLGLKHIPFLDVILLVAGFLLRVMYGAALIHVGLSSWVYLTVISLSFYLGLGKRRNELKKAGVTGNTRKVLTYYTYQFLDKFMYLCLTLAIAFYALWSADKDVVANYQTDKLIWTVPFVIVLLMKYSADIESDSYGDPVDVITHDRALIILSGIFCITLMALIYFPI
ncbi:decaprenyl-phosphate phosphoribosyltransferase [Lawsonibacter sp. LCP25S3_F5]